MRKEISFPLDALAFTVCKVNNTVQGFIFASFSLVLSFTFSGFLTQFQFQNVMEYHSINPQEQEKYQQKQASYQGGLLFISRDFEIV